MWISLSRPKVIDCHHHPRLKQRERERERESDRDGDRERHTQRERGGHGVQEKVMKLGGDMLQPISPPMISLRGSLLAPHVHEKMIGICFVAAIFCRHSISVAPYPDPCGLIREDLARRGELHNDFSL